MSTPTSKFSGDETLICVVVLFCNRGSFFSFVGLGKDTNANTITLSGKLSADELEEVIGVSTPSGNVYCVFFFVVLNRYLEMQELGFSPL